MINTLKSHNKTSLHLASVTSSLCTHILLKNNASNNIKDNHGIISTKLALIYGREDNFNIIGTSDKVILDFYNELNKLDKNKIYSKENENDMEKHNEIYSNNEMEKLCEFMSKNNLKDALKITDVFIENKIIMEEIKNHAK